MGDFIGYVMLCVDVFCECTIVCVRDVCVCVVRVASGVVCVVCVLCVLCVCDSMGESGEFIMYCSLTALWFCVAILGSRKLKKSY